MKIMREKAYKFTVVNIIVYVRISVVMTTDILSSRALPVDLKQYMRQFICGRVIKINILMNSGRVAGG